MSEAVLDLWNEGATKNAIVAFVERVTTQGSLDYVEPAARVAVFDNDGTLWCEKPMPIQADFLLHRIGEMAAQDASLRDKQPWKAVWEKDYAWLSNAITQHYQGDDSALNVMAGGLLQAYAGESVDSFAVKADHFMRTAQNPALKRPYLETAYAPMVELLKYLAANGFTNYIASGGTRDFMRPVTMELYSIPPERVIGSTVALEYRSEDGVGNIYHQPKLDVFDDGPAKAVRIWSRIGQRPILAAGNSNGDMAMLEFAAHSTRPSLSLLVNHDDNAWETAYSSGAEKLMEAAKEKGWTVVSVKDDWKQVF